MCEWFHALESLWVLLGSVIPDLDSGLQRTDRHVAMMISSVDPCSLALLQEIAAKKLLQEWGLAPVAVPLQQG